MGARVILKGQELTTLEKFNKTVGEISNLTTEDKLSLVNAINEIKSISESVGGTIFTIELDENLNNFTANSSAINETLTKIINANLGKDIVVNFRNNKVIYQFKFFVKKPTMDLVIYDKVMGILYDQSDTGVIKKRCFSFSYISSSDGTIVVNSFMTHSGLPTSSIVDNKYVDTAIANAISTSITSVLESEF